MRCAVLQNEMILERQFREAWFLTAVFIHNIHTCVYSNNQTALSYPQMPRFLKFLREFWSMPLPLMIHSALALFAQRSCIPTSARSIGFCVIWVCISSSSLCFGMNQYCPFAVTSLDLMLHQAPASRRTGNRQLAQYISILVNRKLPH